MFSLSFFGGARNGEDSSLSEDAQAVGAWLGQRECFIKYGGSAKGIMGAFARGVLGASGNVENGKGATLYGILPEKYHAINNPESLGIAFEMTATLAERKARLLEDVDAFLVFPGGIGTLDEICEVVEEDYLPVKTGVPSEDSNTRPLLLYNRNGYYDGTIAQLKRMVGDGFVAPEKIETILFLNTIDDILKVIEDCFTGRTDSLCPARQQQDHQDPS